MTSKGDRSARAVASEPTPLVEAPSTPRSDHDIEAGQSAKPPSGSKSVVPLEVKGEDSIADGAEKSDALSFCSCGSDGGQLSLIQSKIAYTVFVMIAVILAIILKYSNPGVFSNFYSFDNCFSDVCRGNSAAYRMSFGAASFFFFMIIFTAVSSAAHWSHWVTKFICFGGLCVIGFLIPGSGMVVYAEIARVLSFFFLLLQILILVNFVHLVHEALLAKISGDDEGEAKKARVIYLLLSLFVFALGIVGYALLWKYHADCGVDIALEVIGFLLGICGIALSIAVQQGVLAPSLVFAYAAFLSFQAVESNPDSACNADVTGQPTWILVVSIGITVISLGWNAVNAADTTPMLFDAGKKAAEPAPAPDPKAARWWPFHLVMFLAACYVSMLVTSWGSTSSTSLQNSDFNAESMWIKWSCMLVLYALYIWTLLAPRIFPDRDFSA